VHDKQSLSSSGSLQIDVTNFIHCLTFTMHTAQPAPQEHTHMHNVSDTAAEGQLHFCATSARRAYVHEKHAPVGSAETQTG